MRLESGASSVPLQTHSFALLRLSPRHWRLLLVLVALQIFDGFDLLAMSFASVGLKASLHLDAASLGIIFSSAYLGSTVGALLSSAMASAMGRRNLLILTTLTLGIASLATACSGHVSVLVVCRLVTGLALGVLAPLIVGYASEFFPQSTKGIAISVILSAVELGPIIGGVVASPIISRWGWEAVFIVGSIGPLVVGGLMWMVPHSPMDMARSGIAGHRVHQVCEQYGIDFPIVSGRRSKLSLRSELKPLLLAGRRSLLIGMLITMLLAPPANYVVNTWMVLLLQQRGATQATAILCLSFYHFGGLIGTLAIGWLMDRYPPQLLLPITLYAAAPFFAALILVPATSLYLHSVCLVAAMFLTGSLLSLMTFCTIAFPNEIRLHVLGALTLIARVSGVLAPLGAGYFLSAGHEPARLFYIVVAMICAAASILLASVLISRRAEMLGAGALQSS